MLNLNRSDCKALNLNDLYGLHKAIYSLFPAEPGKSRDFLFVDKGGDWNRRHILILSEREPIQPEFGEIVSKKVPDSFLQHDYYGFELALNPTRRDSNTGKIFPVRGRAQLIDWLVEKAPGHGFEVFSQSLQINHIGVVTYQKNGTIRTHNTATFVGTLKVIERAAFVESFQRGIGRAKGFGFGLLQLVPMEAQNNISAS
ncbi:MAG: type I-E CRISPR-associated protein Cas6/Cse3/CasE [Desulfobacteraceae bacterium]|nr:type I-E CRISPR-associated protein Cas6/Cse3/CasE [Desulfobacteraceae bacterium]